MKLLKISLLILVNLSTATLKSQCGFVYYKKVCTNLLEYKTANERIDNLIVKYNDTLNTHAKKLQRITWIDDIDTRKDSLESFILFLGNYRECALNDIEKQEDDLEQLLRLLIKEKFDSFIKSSNLQNIELTFNETIDRNCIDYSNLFLKFIQTD